VDPAGTITTFAGTGAPAFSGDGGPAASADLSNPNAAATDDAGNVYISDAANGRIRRVDPSGTITTVAGDGTSIGTPISLAVDAAGTLYVGDSSTSVVYAIAGGTKTALVGDGRASGRLQGVSAETFHFTNPLGVTVDGAGGFFIGDTFA